MLYIIPTPVGNRQDMTLRAIEVLQSTTVLLCEDTRTTKKICQLHNIDIVDKKLYPFDSYTSPKQVENLMELLKKEEVWLLSEAGTPWLSDPGKVLVQYCVQYQVPYTVLPGPTALVPAIVGAWFPTHRFTFLWFLPTKKGRKTMLASIVNSPFPVFVYESVYRVEKLLLEMEILWFKGYVSVARELSKMYEQYITADISLVKEKIQKKEIPMKWEFVLGFCSYDYFQNWE